MKRSEVRQHIIKTASDLFYQKGYNLTGINEIIKEANIAKATLYNHFESKEDICLAYLQYKNDNFVNEIKSFVDRANPGKDKLYSLFYFLKEFFDQKDFNGCWCLNTVVEVPDKDSKIRKEIQKQKKEFIDYITGLVEQHFDRNSDSDNKALAQKIYLLYESSISESKLHQNKWPIDACLSLCKNIVN